MLLRVKYSRVLGGRTTAVEACLIGDCINTEVLVVVVDDDDEDEEEETVIELLEDSPVVLGTAVAATTAAPIAFEPNKFRRAGEGGGTTPPFCGIEIMGEA